VRGSKQWSRGDAAWLHSSHRTGFIQPGKCKIGIMPVSAAVVCAATAAAAAVAIVQQNQTAVAISRGMGPAACVCEAVSSGAEATLHGCMA
jgi:uncharacterized protein YraI